tara:strand:+ start:236 stop:481 length:246 start_codon:yes stop_codon:yes gene_type:complete
MEKLLQRLCERLEDLRRDHARQQSLMKCDGPYVSNKTYENMLARSLEISAEMTEVSEQIKDLCVKIEDCEILGEVRKDEAL